MDLKSRLKAVCCHFGLSIREFERECQLNRGNISNMTGALGSDKIAKIITRFPEINAYWLLTGEGYMLNGVAEQSNLVQEDGIDPRTMEPSHQKLIRLLKEELHLLNEQIRLQQKQIDQFHEAMDWMKKREKFL